MTATDNDQPHANHRESAAACISALMDPQATDSQQQTAIEILMDLARQLDECEQFLQVYEAKKGLQE